MDLDSADLESNKPNALDNVADNQEVLHGPKRRNVYPNIEERNADQAFILVERSHKDLGRSKVNPGAQTNRFTAYLLSHRGH